MDIILEVLKYIVGFILGLLAYKYFPSYVSRKGSNKADIEDTADITDKSEGVKHGYKILHDLSKVERDFYHDMTSTIQDFLAVMKRYELEADKGENYVNRDVIMSDDELKEKYLNFVDSTNEILAKAYVFFDDDKYELLHGAIDFKSTFAKTRYSLLDAMRRSLHSDTKFKAKDDTWDMKY